MNDTDFKLLSAIKHEYPQYFTPEGMANFDELAAKVKDDAQRELVIRIAPRYKYASEYTRQYNRCIAGRGSMPLTYDEQRYGRTVQPPTRPKIVITKQTVKEMGF